MSGTGIGWQTPLERPARAPASRRRTQLTVASETAQPRRRIRRWPLWIGLVVAFAAAAAMWALLALLLVSAIRVL